MFQVNAIRFRSLRLSSFVLLTLALILLPLAARSQAPGTCDGMQLGTTATAGTVGGDLSGFIPFPPDNAWNTDISSAPVDPNSDAIVATWSTTIPIINITIPDVFTAEFGNGTNADGVPDNGIPYIVVDSSVTPSQSIIVTNHAAQGDVVVAPFPSTPGAVPIEGAPADCAGWPNTPASTNQALVLDRATCWLYETYSTTSCNGQYEAARETIWDMANDESRPWGWISTDTAGLAVFPGLVRYDEANSGSINHAIAISMSTTNGDANGGYYVLPASYSAATTATANALPMGARLRLNPTTNISNLSPINQAIATAMMTYGMIVVDNTNNFGIEGTPDARWDSTDLGVWGIDGLLGTAPNATNLQVIQMDPAYPGMDNTSVLTDFPGTAPVINTYTANGHTGTYSVSAGTPLTFEFSATGASYVYIDNIGPARLTDGDGSLTINASATQEYTLYATNAWGRVSSTIQIDVPNSVVTAPVFNPSPAQTGVLNAAQKVTISTPTSSSATIYYTTDGSTPMTTSTVYTGLVTVETGCSTRNIVAPETLEAIAVVANYTNPSAVSTATYTCGGKTATPTFSPGTGTYDGTQTVTISDTTAGSSIYYTTDGTTPTTASALYSAPITVAVSQTVEALAVLAADSNSNVATAVYTINPPAAATPTFAPPAGTYNSIQSVTISDTTANSSIYYTTNGGTPTTNSTPYIGPVTVAVSQTLRAIAVANSFSNSAVGSARYTITLPAAATPTFNPTAGSYTSVQTVTISDTTPDATIYYTVTAGTTGTTPTTASSVYSTPITVGNTEVIEALAVESGYSNSVVGTAKYTITLGTTVATPVFAPVAGTYTSIQTVTISDSTASSVIYYTVDGSTPVYPPGGTTALYTGPLTISKTTTVKAIGELSGDNNSTVASATYTINLPAAATPTFNPVAGTYTSVQTVTISDTTGGASIYYTTNGGTPTTNSAAYTAPITVAVTQTLKAIAIATGSSSSAAGSAAYTINIPTTATPVLSPASNTLLTPFTAPQTVTISDSTSGSTIYYTTNGTAPTTASAVYEGPFTVSNTTAYGTVEVEALATKATLANSTVATVTYYFDLSGAAGPTFSPGTGIYAGVQTVTISDTTPDATIYYTVTSGTVGTTPTTASSIYTTPISVTPASVVKAFAVVSGYPNSAITTATYSSESAAPTPTFNPTAGSYALTQNVSIGDVAPGAAIYYTTNGSAPTTNSARYILPIPIAPAATATTVEAIATASNYTISAVGTAVYYVPTPAALTTPTPGTVLPGTSVGFAWTPGGAATHFELWLGSTGVGTSNLYNSGSITGTATTAGSLPDNGELVYARLYYLVYGTWYSQDYTYTAAGSPVLPAITAPTPSTTLSGTSVSFAWSTGNIATNYRLWVGTGGAGASNIYNSGTVTATTELVSNLPSNGGPVNVRLGYFVNGAWAWTDYTYTATGSPTPAVLTTPTPNTLTPLSGTSVEFSWTPGNTATHFEFYVGTTGVGSSNVYNSGSITATSAVVSGLPNNGGTVYVRLYYLINGNWESTSYTYVASGTSVLPAITAPTPSTTLSGTSVSFAWSTGNIATNYRLWVGTGGAGASNIYNSGTVTATTELVNNLPSNGGTVNVRLGYLVNGAWESTDYTYTATGSPILAALTTPTPNTLTPLSGTSVAFAWTPGNVATNFEFYAGTTGVGSNNLYNSGSVTATTERVSNLPSNGETVYVRLYSLVNGTWQSTDYTYVASGSPTLAALTTPTPNTLTPLSGTSVAFTWTPGNTATHFEFYVGTTGVGSSNLYNSGSVTATTETVNNLPTNGSKVYVRLYYFINGTWQYTDYTYVAFSPTPAVLTTPTPNTLTPLSGTSVAFSWTPGNTATHFEFYVGTTGLGSSNLYNSGSVTATTKTVSNLPNNSAKIYARLYYLIFGTWEYTDYTYVAHGTAVLPALTTPTPSTKLSGTSVSFAWSTGNNLATNYRLWVGTGGAGASNIYNSGTVTGTTELVSNLPSNGETVNVRLGYLVSGTWESTDYTYTATGSPISAALTTPTPNTLTPLSGTSVAFAWTPGNVATNFEFYAGTTGVGSNNLYNSGSVTATTERVSNLPSNGETVYVRLYSLVNGTWQSTDYTYVASGSPTPAVLTTPTPNTLTPLSGTSVAFTWTPGNTATHFEFYVGTTGVGSSNLYNSGSVTATTETVSNLPSNGATIYVRLYYFINGVWEHTDYTYVAH